MSHKNGMSAWQLTMLALGTIVGGSFFLGSAIAIRTAGPAIFISYILGGILVYIILTALSEMTVASPAPGSFRTHSEKAFGPFIGFITGWIYWTGLVLAMSSEATAAAFLMRTWVPQISLPLLAISIVSVVTILNLLGAKILSRLENGLAAIKLLALVAFIVIGIVLITGIIPGKPPVGAGVLKAEAFFPNGIGGIAGSMLIVLFSYAGFEIIGLAASEAKDPHKTVPRAIILTVIALVGLYLTVIGVLLPLISTGALTEETSPMVAALGKGGLSVAAGAVNFILVTAILSTMLAATFGLGRMARSIADAGNAPAILIDKGEVPLRGILFSGISMFVGAALSYVLPRSIYIFLVSSGGFAILFTYVIILFTHYKHRAANGCPPKGNCQLSGFPYTSWIAIAGLIVVIITMPLVPGQGSGLFAGIMLVTFYSLAYAIFKALPSKLITAQPAAKPHKEKQPNDKNN